MDRKNINRGFKKLMVWRDAISLYILASKIFINYPFELKKGYERRTSNVQRRILNKVFCQFINWRSDPPASPERDNKRTKSIEYGSRWRAGAISSFDVRRSMFDVRRSNENVYSRRNGKTL